MFSSLKYFSCLFFLCCITSVRSQDIHFSQFTLTPLIQNPAMAGAAYNMQGVLNYKEQWKSVNAPYKTVNASFDMRFKKKTYRTEGFFAGGANIFSDNAGDSEMKTLHAELVIAYHVKTGDKSTLGFGLMGGFAQRSINTASLQWGRQYDGFAFDPNLSSGEQQEVNSISYGDIGTGIVWAFDKGEKYMTGNNQVKGEAGIAAFHLNQPKYSFYESGEKLNIKFVAHANVLIGISNSNLSVVPGLMYYSQGSSDELLIGSGFKYLVRPQSKYTGFITGSAFSFGIYTRAKDSYIALVQFERGSYSFGISYDLNSSDLSRASSGNGGIELSLRFLNPNPF